jgi:hypothetical protein
MQTKNPNLFINSDAFYKTQIHTIIDWIVTSSQQILVQAIFLLSVKMLEYRQILSKE